jgi:predicted metal-dependent hydrolase
MASKIIHVDGVGEVTISKRKGQRSIRIAVSGSQVKITQPSWLPFSASEAFIATRMTWIMEHLKQELLYTDGGQIGISHTLKLAKGRTLSRRITANTLLITYPKELESTAKSVQKYITLSIHKVLRNQANTYLPQRTKKLADMFGFSFSSVSIRMLKRRWGSCNSKKEITFNLKLMELDALHIDYVILHELTHTLYMNHGPEFWAHMESVMPNSRKIAKKVRHLDA